jgi:hypothetical protein
MKRKRFSVEQIVAVLKQAETCMPVAELIRHVGRSPMPVSSMNAINRPSRWFFLCATGPKR